ncbi:MAG: EamA family transporter [Clostridiales bacterium]|nr:EamA family transporter [Clostridiales bacterium]
MSELRSRHSLQQLLLLHGTLFLYAVVSIFAKLAGINMELQNTQLTFVYLGLEVLTLLIYSILWQQTLKRMPLSFAFSNKGICTLWTYLFGICFFGESITWGKAIGLVVVLIGVLLVVTDHE